MGVVPVGGFISCQERELELLMGCILVSSENTENKITENNFFSFSTFVHKVRFVFRKRFVRENEKDAPNVYLWKTGNKNRKQALKTLPNGPLYALKDKAISMAVASRSPTPDIAKSFLQTLGIYSLFVTQEIFSSWTHKTEHIQRIHATTGVPFSSILFFDDEDRNIQTVSKMGVTSILVRNGVNLGALRQGLLEFSRKSASSSRR